VSVGRIKVIIVSVVVAALNGWLCKRAAAQPDPIQTMEILTLIGIPWIVAGAWGLCTRKPWGRALTLGVLYAGSFGTLMAWIAGMTGDPGPLRQRALPLLAGIGVYVVGSLVLTKSRDVRRLTSRALE
jgi:hypothetical protein